VGARVRAASDRVAWRRPSRVRPRDGGRASHRAVRRELVGAGGRAAGRRGAARRELAGAGGRGAGRRGAARRELTVAGPLRGMPRHELPVSCKKKKEVAPIGRRGGKRKKVDRHDRVKNRSLAVDRVGAVHYHEINNTVYI
jgi:hypothetical protein